MRYLEPHPCIDQFPTLGGAAFDALVDDIRHRGLRRPIALFDGLIWDGRARYAACERLGIKPKLRPLWRKDMPIEYLILRSRDQKYGAPKSPERDAALDILHGIDDPAHVAEFKNRRAAWLAKARADFKWQACRVENCAVCGKHAEFAHGHHTLPLNIQFDLGIDDADHSHDWLCPTHHRYVHMMISVYITETRDGGFLDCIPSEQTQEWLAVERLFQKSTDLLKAYGGNHGGWRGHDLAEWD